MQVAIIGAGSAGLCCARHLSRFPQRFHIQVFEKAAVVGGTWVYTENTERDEFGLPVHTSMYKNLRTNLPKEVMAFSEFPFDPSLPSFPNHWDVLDYLQKFAAHFDLNKFIKFRTLVEQVVPVPMQKKHNSEVSFDSGKGECTSETPNTDCKTQFDDDVKWRVTTQSAVTGERSIKEYDMVLVCNGHFFQPFIPEISGLEGFLGKVIHSRLYRDPASYMNQKVLVVGARQSGKDIILDLSHHANSVYLCNTGPLITSTLPSNVEQLPAINAIQPDGIVKFVNGTERQVDTIILCTGYNYAFPFLTEESGIQVENRRIMRLYKHTFNVIHPSMAFVGVNFHVNPWPLSELQVLWILSVWSGEKRLPSTSEMILDSDLDYQSRLQAGLPLHFAHELGSKQWAFCDELAQLGGSKPLPRVIHMLYEKVTKDRGNDLTNYRNVNYKIVSDDKWIKVDKTTNHE